MIRLHIIIFLFLSTCLSQNLTDTRLNDFPITGEEYVSGDDGIIRIYVNIWGHVKYPGTYLVYDGINVVNAISLAGGPNDGADLKKILLRSAKNSDNKTINLEEKVSSEVLSPFDTIMVQEKLSNKILTRSSLIGALFQLINLVYTIENLNND